MTYSSGYKSELAYAQLAYTLLDIAGEVEVSDSRYEANKKLTRRLLKLKEELGEFLLERSRYGIDFSSKYDKLINRLKQEKLIQPDFLACYLLLKRFQTHERDKLITGHLWTLSIRSAGAKACIDMIIEILSDELVKESSDLACTLGELL